MGEGRLIEGSTICYRWKSRDSDGDGGVTETDWHNGRTKWTRLQEVYRDLDYNLVMLGVRSSGTASSITDHSPSLSAEFICGLNWRLHALMFGFLEHVSVILTSELLKSILWPAAKKLRSFRVLIDNNDCRLTDIWAICPVRIWIYMWSSKCLVRFGHAWTNSFQTRSVSSLL